MTDLAPVGAQLVDRAADLQSRCVHRATQAVLDADDYDDHDFDQARTEGLETMRARRWSQIIPSRFVWATIGDLADPAGEHYQPVVAGDLGAWAARPSGRNLLIVGNVGVGKTYAAVAAARLCHDQGMEVRFLPVGEMLDLLKAEMNGTGGAGALYALADVDVLVLDDVGAERPTDWTAERFYALVNRRWLEERPTVYTSNMPATRRSAPEGYLAETLDERVGPRAFSRIVGSGAVVIRMTGPDRRRTNRG